jgi:ferredoxin-fold anticodon binding domain-containing protein
MSAIKKINKLLKSISKTVGMNHEDAWLHVGECMEDDDVLFTDSGVNCAMLAVYEEVLVALKDDPAALAKVQQHFSK